MNKNSGKYIWKKGLKYLWFFLREMEACSWLKRKGFFSLTQPFQLKIIYAFSGSKFFWNRSKSLKLEQKSKIENTFYTLFEIFIFCPKIQLWFPEKIVDFLGVKNSWKCCGFGLFSCWQLWFHVKNCQKKFGLITRENVRILSKLNFWTKIWLFE